MEIVAKRIRALRDSIGVSQKELGELLGIPQQSINRYENKLTNLPLELLVKYADYFDVSADYLLGRTKKPQGKLYNFEPKYNPNKENMKQFIDMCFEEDSPMRKALKESLYKLMEVSADE